MTKEEKKKKEKKDKLGFKVGFLETSGKFLFNQDSIYMGHLGSSKWGPTGPFKLDLKGPSMWGPQRQE